MRNVLSLKRVNVKWSSRLNINEFEAIQIINNGSLEDFKNYILSQPKEVKFEDNDFSPFQDFYKEIYKYEDKWSVSEDIEVFPRAIGYQRNTLRPFLVYFKNENNNYDVYVMRVNSEEFNRMKEEKADQFTKASVKKWLKENKDNLWYKSDYKYTDDYALDYANNYSEDKEYCKIDPNSIDEFIERILLDLSYKSYTVSGKKSKNQVNIFSSWRSYNLMVK